MYMCIINIHFCNTNFCHLSMYVNIVVLMNQVLMSYYNEMGV